MKLETLGQTGGAAANSRPSVPAPQALVLPAVSPSQSPGGASRAHPGVLWLQPVWKNPRPRQPQGQQVCVAGPGDGVPWGSQRSIRLPCHQEAKGAGQ